MSANKHTAVLAFQFNLLEEDGLAVNLALRRPNLRPVRDSCGRTPTETHFRPSDMAKPPNRMLCGDRNAEAEFKRRNPHGKRCVCCDIAKQCHEFVTSKNRLSNRCKVCADLPVLRDPKFRIKCKGCGIIRQAHTFNNDHLQQGGKDDHCRHCRASMRAEKPESGSDTAADGFEDDPQAATADIHGRVQCCGVTDITGIGATSLGQMYVLPQFVAYVPQQDMSFLPK